MVKLILFLLLIFNIVVVNTKVLHESSSSPSSSTSSTSISFPCDFEKISNLSSFSFCNVSLDITTRVKDLVERLTLQEKIGFLKDSYENISRLGLPSYQWWSEALHGVGNDEGKGTKFTPLVPGATNFPQVICTAAAFNLSLFKSIGEVVSTEARAMHNLGLAGLTFWSPNINIFRDPRWGRGQETPGEDPLLASKYGSAYVRGLQQTNDRDVNRLKVAACCKHYTAYDLDKWKGVNRYQFNAVVTQQDLEDTYQPPFRSCVMEGKVASVMCSYNQVNGKPTCADPDLLAGVIRGQWNLNGYIVSDCDSVRVLYENQHYTKYPEEAAATSILAGLDLDCGNFLSNHTESAIKARLLNVTDIDKAISHSFATLMRLGFFDGDPLKQPYGKLGPSDVCSPNHQQLALEAARQGIVLLKNMAGSLPLSPAKIKSLAVIGPNANVTKTMLGNYAGMPCKFTTPLQGLAATVPTLYSPGCPDIKCISAELDDAMKIASQADATVLIVGGDQSIEAEYLDRVDLVLPGQQPLLITQVANASKGPVILVVMSGGGFDISFAKEDEKIKGILWVGYPGEAGGLAIADVIFAVYSPSGRLPMTWYPQRFADTVPMTNMNMRPDPASGYPGRSYRFYTGESIYQFGEGLSYTEFEYVLIKPPKFVTLGRSCSQACNEDRDCQELGFKLQLRIGNIGNITSSHTVLIFSTPPQDQNAPQKSLLAFKKVLLAPKAEEKVRFGVNLCRDLSIADEFGRRRVAVGSYVLQVGNLKHILSVRI